MRFLISESINDLIILPTIGYDIDNRFLFIQWLTWQIGIVFDES